LEKIGISHLLVRLIMERRMNYATKQKKNKPLIPAGERNAMEMTYEYIFKFPPFSFYEI